MPPERKAHKVLIVDDEIFNIEFLKILLQEQIDIIFATTGAPGRRRLLPWAAAILVVVASGAAWFYQGPPSTPDTTTAPPQAATGSTGAARSTPGPRSQPMPTPGSLETGPAKLIPSETDTPKIATTPGAPGPARPTSGFEWVKRAGCPTIPKVEWWSTSDHQKIALYVSIHHQGDWSGYLDKWTRQLKKMESSLKRGSHVRSPTGKILKGPSLRDYVEKTRTRVAAISCLTAASQTQ